MTTEDLMPLVNRIVVVSRYRDINHTRMVPEVELIRRGSLGEDVWSIDWAGQCLCHDGTWTGERQPSSRSDEHIFQTRFTLQDALHSVKIAFAPLKEEMGPHGKYLVLHV